MKLEEVLQLFVIVGGTVGITFQIAWKTSALCGLGSQTFAGRNVQTGYEQGTGGFIAQSGFEETVQDVQPFRKGCPFSRHLVL